VGWGDKGCDTPKKEERIHMFTKRENESYVESKKTKKRKKTDKEIEGGVWSRSPTFD